MAHNGEEYYAAQSSSFETLYAGLEWVQEHGDMYGDDWSQQDDDPDREGRALYLDLMREFGDQGGDVDEDAIREALDEMPLCIDIRKVYSIVLSFGGPNASIEVTTYSGVIESIEYSYGWGGETYSKRLTEHDAMGRYAIEQVERMVGYGIDNG